MIHGCDLNYLFFLARVHFFTNFFTILFDRHMRLNRVVCELANKTERFFLTGLLSQTLYFRMISSSFSFQFYILVFPVTANDFVLGILEAKIVFGEEEEEATTTGEKGTPNSKRPVRFNSLPLLSLYIYSLSISLCLFSLTSVPS